MRMFMWFGLGLTLAMTFCLVFLLGINIGQAIFQPQTVEIPVTVYEMMETVVPKYMVVPWEVLVPIYPNEFRKFQSQEELGRWQAKHYLGLRELGRQNNWVCVDYALELQRKAWLEGYQMSVENLIDGDTGHAICTTWIGDKCIYLEPQNTSNWVGAVKATPISK